MHEAWYQYGRRSDLSSGMQSKGWSHAAGSEEFDAPCRFDRHSVDDDSILLCAAANSPTVCLGDCSPSLSVIGRLQRQMKFREIWNDRIAKAAMPPPTPGIQQMLIVPCCPAQSRPPMMRGMLRGERSNGSPSGTVTHAMPEKVVLGEDIRGLRAPSRKRHATKAFAPAGTVCAEHFVTLIREAMSRRGAG